MKTSLSHLGSFILHFMGMCLAMCVGGIALNVAFFGALSLFGATYSEDQLPTFALIAIGVNLAMAMVIWMRLRKHEWRSTLEMASTSIILALAVVGAAGIGLIDASDRLATLTSLACPVMLIPMALRWGLYAHPHAPHSAPTAT